MYTADSQTMAHLQVEHYSGVQHWECTTTGNLTSHIYIVCYKYITHLGNVHFN